MKGLRCVVVCCFAGAAWAVAAQPVVLAGWDVAGVDLDQEGGVLSNAPPYTFFATTSDVSHVQAWLALGAGVNPSTSADQYGFKISSGAQTNTLAGAIALDHYLEFSISVDDGYRLNLASIEMTGGGSGTGCSNVVLMSSVDGFSAEAEIASAFPANSEGGLDTDESGFGGPIDLSAPVYQGLTGTVAFRLYGWNSTSGAGSTRIRNLSGEDLILGGEVLPVSAPAMPVLSIMPTNDVMRIAVRIESDPAAVYVLQRMESLSDTNGWHTVSAPFSGGTNWMVTVTNAAAFYRVTSE